MSRTPKEWPPELKLAIGQAIVLAAAENDKGRKWAAPVADALGLSLDVLPASLTREDVSRVAELVPSERHSEICCFLILVSLGMQDEAARKQSTKERHYSARDRARIFVATSALKVDPLRVYEAEAIVAEQLVAALKAAEQAGPDTSSAVAAAAGKSKLLRRIAIGAGAVTGGIVLGVTGGLAAPALLAVTGGAISLGAGGAVTLGVLFGLGGTGLGAYRAKRRFADIQEFEFERLNGPHEEKERNPPPALATTICCSGFLIQQDDYTKPFLPAFDALPLQQEAWALKAETAFFLSQGQAIDTYLRDKLISKGASEIIKRTALSAFYAAVALPATVYSSFTTLIDNNWQRSADKANKIGLLLADVLEEEIHGKRPCSLVGSGLGALTVFRALVELQKRGKRDIVFDVYLISLPRAPSAEEWAAVRQVVCRRLVNVFSTNDWVLALVARLHSLSWGVAGLAKVELEGVENVDVSDLLEGHLALRERMPAILDRIGLMQ